MALVDIANQKFGRLTVLFRDKEEESKHKDRHAMWHCLCECGNEVTVVGKDLRQGKTQSCGCLQKEKTSQANGCNLLGKIYGKLTVISQVNSQNYRTRWLCRCECGNFVEVTARDLQAGNTQSCGCLQKERTSASTLIPLIGNHYGKLTIIERVDNNRFGHICYRCKCDCGGETIVDAANLRNGNTNSCGCIKSKGEMIINNWLQEHGFNFRSQYSFDDCVLSTGRRPFFDFVLFKNDKPYLVIEYNGRQHYEATGGWNTEEEFAKTQRRDSEKLQWCEDNHYPVLIIKYDEDIFKVLEGIIKDAAAAPDMEEAQEVSDDT